MKRNNYFGSGIQVARVYGIPVRIDYRWFFIFALSVWLVASNFAQGSARVLRADRVDVVAAWSIGIIVTLALFFSVFGHELAHALAARSEDIETEEIVLHPFGGLARLRREPDSPRAEFRIAVAGPAASFIFALLGLGAARGIVALGEYWTAATIFWFVGFANLLLAVFNLLPGYPLDGGRVLRAYLWHRTGNLQEATRQAGLGGQVIAWTLIAFGVYIVVAWNDYFMGGWSVLVGLFLRSAAVSVVKATHGTTQPTVADAMAAPVAVEPDAFVSYFVDDLLPLHRQTAMLVAREKRLHGILTLADLQAVPRDRWHRTRVSEVMRPVDAQFFVGPSTLLAHAEVLMQQNGAGAVAVINNVGELIGFLQRGQRVRPRISSQ
ncbi:MAG: site-2 protease family protein [Pyrinomonadaceae bacterium]|nr:site-2 protease family protein [Pyrinomonadaceae bacterium]